MSDKINPEDFVLKEENKEDNIYRNHEWLKDMDDEKLHHAWMLKQNLDVIKDAEPKLEEVEGQLKQYEELMSVIHKKFGFVESDKAIAVDPKDLENESEGDS